MQLEFAWILWSVVLQPLHMQQGCLHLSWDLIRMSRVFRSNQKKTDPKEHKEQGMMDQALESKNLLNSRTGATGCNMIMMQLCPSSSIIPLIIFHSTVHLAHLGARPHHQESLQLLLGDPSCWLPTPFRKV